MMGRESAPLIQRPSIALHRCDKPRKVVEAANRNLKIPRRDRGAGWNGRDEDQGSIWIRNVGPGKASHRITQRQLLIQSLEIRISDFFPYTRSKARFPITVLATAHDRGEAL